MQTRKLDRITTTIEIDKQLFLRFKAMCILREENISAMIERILRKWVEAHRNERV